MLRTKIPSDLEEMQKLHELHSWVPGKHSIRPTSESIERKHQFNDMIKRTYASETDYIYETVFQTPSSEEDGRRKVDRSLLTKHMRMFERNEFAYDLPADTRHFVMWYTYGKFE